jgi:hypothetical protein
MRRFAPVRKFFWERSDEDASAQRTHPLPILFPYHRVQGSPLPRKFETAVVSKFNKVISPSHLLLVEANSGI